MAAAATWVWRMDRGLSAAEQDELFAWLAEHPDHTEALRRCRQHWRRLDALGEWRPEHSFKPNPDLLAPHRQRRPQFRPWPLAWAAAACVLLSLGVWRWASPAPVEVAAVRHENRQILADQSTVKLNQDAAISVAYTATERRVRLEQGEAFFIVTKDPARPFIVEAAGVAVRAVGTAFNVQVSAGAVDVLVAEGVVAVTAGAMDSPGAGVPRPTVVVQQRQQVLVPLAPEAAVGPVTTLDERDVQRSLAWQHGLMTFQDKPLAEIVAELNRLNDTQLVLVDETLAATRFSGTIRSDNLSGFAQLLQSGFGAQIEQADAGVIRLRAKKQPI